MLILLSCKVLKSQLWGRAADNELSFVGRAKEHAAVLGREVEEWPLFPQLRAGCVPILSFPDALNYIGSQGEDTASRITGAHSPRKWAVGGGCSSMKSEVPPTLG